MPLIPRLSKPCPLSAAELPAEGDFHCGHCDRVVHDLTPLDDDARRAFVSACNGPVCVRVRFPARGAAVACGAAAAAAAAPATAGDLDDIDWIRVTTPRVEQSIGEIPALVSWIEFDDDLEFELLPGGGLAPPRATPPPSKDAEDDDREG